MPIKDVIGPGFVGSNTIKFIVTRGMGAAISTAHYYFESNHLIGDVSDADKFKKAVAVTGYTVALVNATSGAAMTSGSPSLTITKDGGTPATTTGLTHEGNGQWSFNLSSTQMDADIVGIAITLTNAVPVYRTIVTWE
jgi:hypothetical protein